MMHTREFQEELLFFVHAYTIDTLISGLQAKLCATTQYLASGQTLPS